MYTELLNYSNLSMQVAAALDGGMSHSKDGRGLHVSTGHLTSQEREAWALYSQCH